MPRRPDPHRPLLPVTARQHRSERRDQRSAEAVEWRRLYKTPQWRRLRQAQLSREPLCRVCQALGKVTAATVVDHKQAHRGDLTLFLDPENLMSICAPHHNSASQRRDKTGEPIRVIGRDGWPVEVV